MLNKISSSFLEQLEMNITWYYVWGLWSSCKFRNILVIVGKAVSRQSLSRYLSLFHLAENISKTYYSI